MLEAHHIFFDDRYFFKFPSKIALFISDSVNFKFPIYLIFFAPNRFKCLLDSLLEGRHKSNLLNRFFVIKPSLDHFLKDFLFILAFNRTNEIDLLLIFVSIVGQISESTNIATDGDQYFKNLFTKYV